MNVAFLNPPNTDRGSYIARSADRWPHRVRRGKLFRNKIFAKYPLYMLYAAAVVEHEGHTVKVVDAAMQDLSQSETALEIASFRPDLVAIEIAEASQDSDLETARLIKEHTGATIAVFGPTATTFHSQLLAANDFLDLVFREEPFASVRAVANAIDERDRWKDIKGLSYRFNGSIDTTPDMPLMDIADLPRPARHLLNPKPYLMGHYTYAPQILMLSSIGCPHQCIFCLWPQTLYGPKMRYRDPQDVTDEMWHLKSDWGAREIYFDDDTFNVTEKRALELSEAIIQSGVNIPWICEMRCDQVSDKLMQTMRRANCVKILFGVESGSQKVLDNSGKHLKLEDVRRAFALAHKHGIRTHATFMFGLPGETPETIEQTFAFVREIGPDTIQGSLSMPYPGTKFHQMATEEGWLKVDSLRDFDGETRGAIEYPGLSREQLRGVVDRFYRAYYFRAGYVRRQIGRLRNWSDIRRFLNLGMSAMRRFS